MPPKTLCLVLFDAAEADWLIDQACTLALGLRAHLIAVHPFAPVVYYGSPLGDPYVYPSLSEWEEKASAVLRGRFDEALRKNGLTGEFRSQKVIHGAESFVLGSARPADLLVFGSLRPEARGPDDRGLAERLTQAVGRPVLVLCPERALAGPAERLLVGWSDTREAARAAGDARALAAPGAEIELLTMLAREGDDPPGLDSSDDLASALDRHGFKAITRDRLVAAADRAEILLQHAHDRRAELLVAGAFGHSRVYDFVIGAVTSDLLSTADLPLLLSH